MELFIQIRDGQPYQHPIFGDNFRSAFPHIDVNNLPPEFARFERIERPKPGVFEVVSETPTYQWVNGVVKDVWSIRPMTETEESAKRGELANTVLGMIEFIKETAQKNADTAPSEEAKQAWLDYKTMMETWQPNDIVNPMYPSPPRIQADGTVLTTNAPGRAPNVVG